MAQRTGVDGFLTLLAKAAGARALLALAAAALFVLAGCGGDSEPESDDGSRAASSAQAGSASTAAKGSGPASGQGSSQAKGSRGPSTASPVAANDQSQGQRVAIPEGPREQAPTAAQRAEATLASIILQSPAIRSPAPESIGALPAAHTCDGADSWPALQWQGIPPASAELVLFAMNTEPVGGEIFFDWALAGVDPSLGGIEAARLPAGAIVGKNSFGKRGYSICPALGTETYMFALYALPRRLSPPRGFDPVALRKEILALSANAGFLPATYTRG